MLDVPAGPILLFHISCHLSKKKSSVEFPHRHKPCVGCDLCASGLKPQMTVELELQRTVVGFTRWRPPDIESETAYNPFALHAYSILGAVPLWFNMRNTGEK